MLCLLVLLWFCRLTFFSFSQLLPKLGGFGIFLLILGGVLYTAGGYVYVTEQPNPYVIILFAFYIVQRPSSTTSHVFVVSGIPGDLGSMKFGMSRSFWQH